MVVGEARILAPRAPAVQALAERACPEREVPLETSYRSISKRRLQELQGYVGWAIEVEEGQEEGPSFFILTSDGRTMIFAGQYLDRYKGKGFPWKEFEILEAPESGIFFGLVPCGEPLRPSLRRSPFSDDELKRFGADKYAILDVPFEALKREFRAAGGSSSSPC
jgi:hypothetical protein